MVEALSETVTWLVMTDRRVAVESPSVVAVELLMSPVEVSCSKTVLEVSLPVGADGRADDWVVANEEVDDPEPKVSVLATGVKDAESEVSLLEAEVVTSVSAEVPEGKALESTLWIKVGIVSRLVTEVGVSVPCERVLEEHP